MIMELQRTQSETFTKLFDFRQKEITVTYMIIMKA